MDSIKVSFKDAVFENGYMWVFDNLIQSMCKIDINNFQMRVVSSYKSREKFIAQKIFLFQDKFYLVTRKTREILIYDRKKEGKDSAFCLQKPLSEDRTAVNVAFFLYGSNLYFFPEHIDKTIVCFDACLEEYFPKTALELPQDMNMNMNNSDLLLGQCRFYKETMCFILRGTGIYGKYNFSDEKCEFFQTEKVGQIFSGVGFDGKQVWLITEEQGTICVGKEMEQIFEQYFFTSIYPVEEGVLFLSFDNDKLVFIEKRTFEASIINLPLNEEEKRNIKGYFYCEYDGAVYLFPIMNGPLLVLKKKDWKINRIDLKCENYIRKSFQNEKVLVKEDEYINLEHLLQYFRQDISLYRQEKEADAGKTVWEAVE